MKTKDLHDYYFNIAAYQKIVEAHPTNQYIIDDNIRLVMNYHHEIGANENIKNPSFLMAWNTVTKFGLYVKLEDK